MNTIFDFIKRPLIIVTAVILATGFLIYFFFIKKSEIIPETFIIRRGTISQEVSVTGKTKASEEIDLAFEYAGKVAAVNAKVGDFVSAGQSLVQLDSSELIAQLAEAEANTDVQKAELENLKKGVKPEEIKFYETKLSNAEVSFGNAKKNLIDKIKDGYTKSEDAVRAKIDQIFNNPRSSSPSLVFNSPFKTDLEKDRLSVEFILNSWQNSLQKMGLTSDFNSYLNEAGKNLEQIKLFLEKIALAVSDLTPSSSLTQTTIDTYRSAVSTARTNTNTAISNLQSAEETWRDAEAGVVLAENELALKKIGATAEEIASHEAAMAQAEAKAELYRTKIYKNFLRSPINGVVIKQDAKVGEIISANSVVVSIISLGKYEIEANIPEADIAKVKTGDSAKVTLDAFGSDIIFEARVTKIEPGETIVEGVATYKATFHFTKEGESIKPGMTANIDIWTNKKENVLIIPQRGIVGKNGEKFANILNSDGTMSEIPIKTGLRGIDGNVEIIEGLKEGDKVTISSK